LARSSGIWTILSLVAGSARLSASRIRAEEMLLGALLRRAERGRWPTTAVDLQPHELHSEHAAATFYEIMRLWREHDPDPVPRRAIVAALVDKHGAKRSEADAYLRRLRADVPSQEYIREYVRRIKSDNARLADGTDSPTAGT
jgi:replicative DNA helicase